MTDTSKTTATPADSGQVAPGGSNARAVRDGVDKGIRSRAAEPTSETVTPSQVAQPVNTGEDVAESDAPVRPARTRKAAPPATAKKTAKRK